MWETNWCNRCFIRVWYPQGISDSWQGAMNAGERKKLSQPDGLSSLMHILCLKSFCYHSCTLLQWSQQNDLYHLLCCYNRFLLLKKIIFAFFPFFFSSLKAVSLSKVAFLAFHLLPAEHTLVFWMSSVLACNRKSELLSQQETLEVSFTLRILMLLS